MTSARSGTPTAPRLAEMLSGALGPGALRAVAVEPLRHGARDPLSEQLPLDRVVSFDLVRTKFKPNRKLTGYYRVRLASVAQPRPVAVTWSPDGRVDTFVSPTDPALPQLGRLSDRRELAAIVTTTTGRSPGSPAGLEIRTVRYRPGQRHVLHVVGGRLGHTGMYVKVDRDDAGARSVPVAAELGETVAERCPGASLAEPIGYAESERAALWRGAPGHPLWHHLQHGSADGVRLVHLVGRALRVLHDVDTPVERTHSVAAEAAASLRAGEHLTALLPGEGTRYQDLVTRVVDALDRVDGEPATFVHGDVKCDNLLTVGDRLVRFLDLDRVARAEPALDLGKFLADLRWWCPPGQVRGLLRALRVGYGACDPHRWARADLLSVLFGAKLVARRCAVHDPAWSTEVAARLSATAHVLPTGRWER